MNDTTGTTDTNTMNTATTPPRLGVSLFRSLSCGMVVVFHGFLYWASKRQGSVEDTIVMVNRRWYLKLMSFANLGVDGLIVLSGVLAGMELLRQRSAEFSLLSYIKRKFKKILVPYWMTLIAVWALFSDGDPDDVMFGRCPQNLVLSPVLMNNLAGFGSCGVHLWSVATQIHLLFLFGVAANTVWARCGEGTRRIQTMKTVAAVGVVAGVVLRVAMAVRFGSTFPPPPIDHVGLSQEQQATAVFYYHPLYFWTTSRLTNFAWGVLMALTASESGRDTPGIFRGSTTMKIRLLALATAAAYSALLLAVNYEGGPWRRAWTAPMLFHGSPLVSAVASLLLLATIVTPELSSVWLVQAVARNSYGIYLLHPLIMGRLSRARDVQ
jgi:peptidoglycan/LPS O-acetylase OafA/YrhL